MLTAIFCLLLSATPLFLEEEFHSATIWAENYFWKRKILNSARLRVLVRHFYIFGWKSGIPWKVSLYYSTEGVNLPVGGQVLLLAIWVLGSNTLLHLSELRRSRSLRLLWTQLRQIKNRLSQAWAPRAEPIEV